MHTSLKPIALALAAVVLAALVFPVDAAAQGRKKKSKIDKSEAQATSTAPVSAQVETISFPFDPNLPKYVVVVEPFDYSASGQMSGGGQAAPVAAGGASGEAYTQMDDGTIRTSWSGSYGPQIGVGISKQLMTALNGWPNVVIVEPDAVKNNGDGTYSCKLQPGEVGPFIIRGTITEFSETAEAEGKSKGVNTRRIGAAAGLVGLITGNRDVAAVGAGVAVVGPEFKNEEMKRTGMVGMDVRVLDGRIARVVPGGAFNSTGTFTTISVGSEFSMLGFSSGGGEMAASSLGQATRAAMNDAFTKTHDSLQNAPK